MGWRMKDEEKVKEDRGRIGIGNGRTEERIVEG